MATKTETTTINDIEFSVTQWPAEKAIVTKLRLMKILGASVAALASLSKADSDSDNAEALAKGLESVFNNTKPEQVFKLIHSCVIGTQYKMFNGAKGILDDSKFTKLFSGDDLLNVYKLFIFVMKVNYGNLMKGQLVDKLLAKMKVDL